MAENNIPAKYAKLKDVCEIYSISLSKGYQLINATGCPAVRIGGSIRIDVAAFDKWIKNEFPKLPNVDRRYKKGTPKNPDHRGKYGRVTKMDPAYLEEQRKKRAEKKLQAAQQ